MKNNVWMYSDSTIDKAFDRKLNTHWETGTINKSNFINEIIEEATLNRIVYAERQDSVKSKGFAK